MVSETDQKRGARSRTPDASPAAASWEYLVYVNPKTGDNVLYPAPAVQSGEDTGWLSQRYLLAARVRLQPPRHGSRREVHPDDRHRLPVGAIAATTHRHVSYSNSWRPIYTTMRSRCSICDQPYTFTAREQRHWYEELQIPIECVRVACTSCIAAKKTSDSEMRDLDGARRGHQAIPDPSNGQLAANDAPLAALRTG